jgi:EmrB/QacA subfamily drug resistance transporter
MTVQPICDRAIALAQTGRAPCRRRWLVGLVTILASSLAFVDGSVVNVGLPAIGKDLHARAQDLQWVVNAYLLPLSALLLLGGALGDRYGLRRLLIIGVTVFGIGSAGCALSRQLAYLLLARGLQGLGAALLLPASLAILGSTFEGEARSRMVGIWAASGSVAAAVGPVLGGWLIDRVGWPAIFLINIPLAAAAIALALWAVPRSRPAAGGARLDAAGAAFATGALGLLTWGLTIGSGPMGWGAWSLGAVAVAVVLAWAYVGVERRRGEAAMTPPALFGSKRLVGLNLATLLLYGALGGFLLLLPYRLIQAGGYSATQAGAALLPFTLVMSVLSPVMGGLAGRIGPRPLLLGGSLIVAAGLVLAQRIGGPGGYWGSVLPSVLVIAAGMACAAAPLTTAVLGSVDADHTGSASGLNSAVARSGGLIATALLGVVLAARGPAFEQAFRFAAMVGVGVALAAAACVFVLVDGAGPRREAARTSSR